jgi:hypothetical protein
MEHAEEALKLPMFLPMVFKQIVVDVARQKWTMEGEKP